jgi:hypothetical protein
MMRILRRALILGVVASLATTTVTHASVIAYWRFEAGRSGTAATTIADSSGNNLNGTAINGPTYSSDVPTHIIPRTNAVDELSLNFDGNNQRIAIPDYAKLALTHSMTVEAYVKVNSVPGAFGNIVFRGDDRTSLDPYVLHVVGNQLRFEITDAANNFASVGASIPFNTWLHVAGVLDDLTGALSLYEDGVLKNSVNTTIRPFATLDPNFLPGLGIGDVQSPTFGGQYFNGKIDEVRISDAALAPPQFLSSVPEPSCLLFGGLIAGLMVRTRNRVAAGKRANI